MPPPPHHQRGRNVGVGTIVQSRRLCVGMHHSTRALVSLMQSLPPSLPPTLALPPSPLSVSRACTFASTFNAPVSRN